MSISLFVLHHLRPIFPFLDIVSASTTFLCLSIQSLLLVDLTITFWSRLSWLSSLVWLHLHVLKSSYDRFFDLLTIRRNYSYLASIIMFYLLHL